MRQALSDFREAQRDIELTQCAIDILERVRGTISVVKCLRLKQKVALRRIDIARGKLLK